MVVVDLVKQLLIDFVCMGLLSQFVDNFLQHVRDRPGSHVFRWSTEHDYGGLDHEVLEGLEIHQGGVLPVLLERVIYFLNCVLNFLHGDKEVKIVVPEQFHGVG